MCNKQAVIEVEGRPSGQVRVRVVPRERGRRAEARQRRAFIHSDEFPDCRAGYGRLGKRTQFTHRARKLVKEYAAAIEREYSKDRCRFITATFPTSVEANYEVIAKWSSWIIAQINQFLRDIAPGAAFVYVWEFQKRGCLHVHYLVAHRHQKLLRRIHRRFKRFWIRTLDVLGTKSGTDLFGTSNGNSHRTKTHVVRTAVQAVKKSVARYLAKYLSKDTSKQTTLDAPPPPRWWGANAVSRSLCARFTVRVLSALRPLGEATRYAEKILSELNVAAAPTFKYSSQYATGLVAWVVCLSVEDQSKYLQAAIAGSGILFGDCDTMHMQSRTQAPPLPSAEEVALLFGGRVVEDFGATRRVADWSFAPIGRHRKRVPPHQRIEVHDCAS